MPKKVLFSESIISRIISETIVSETTASEIRDKYYQNVPEQDYKRLVFADPTSNPLKDKMGKYGKWILSLFKQGMLKTGDIPELKDSLTYFDKFKNRIEKKDINQYRSVHELYNAVKLFMEQPNQATSKTDELRKTKQQGAEKVYEDEEWLVIVPKTEQAACLYGKGTRWCTAATGGKNMFDYYNRQGPLYININKRTGEKFQFHFPTRQFMDEEDEPIGRNLPGKIGMSEGLFNFYSPDKFPYAHMLFRFESYEFIEDSEGDDTAIFYVTNDEDDSNEYGWFDYHTKDSLTGNELFLECLEFRNNIAPYKDKNENFNIMGRDGKPLFKKPLQGKGFHFIEHNMGGNLFKVYTKTKNGEFRYNLFTIKGNYVFDNLIVNSFRMGDEIMCLTYINDVLCSCTLDLDGNRLTGWQPTGL